MSTIQESVNKLAESMLAEAERSVFPGEMYIKNTRVPNTFNSKILNFFGLARKFPGVTPVERRTIKLPQSFEPKFIIGYAVEASPLNFEIWYDPYENAFGVFDKHGRPVSTTFPRLTDAVAEFIDHIADIEIEGPLSREEKEKIVRSLQKEKEEQELEQLAKRKIYDIDSAAKRDRPKMRDVNSPPFRESQEFDRDALLAENANSRNMIQDLFLGQVSEYHLSRMTKNSVKKFWQVWGKDVEFPTDFLRNRLLGKLALQKLSSDDADGFFVIGYTFDDKIDLEIWNIKDKTTGKVLFYVFNLTAGKLLAKTQKLRHALNIITDILNVDFGDTIFDKDVKMAQQRIAISNKELSQTE